MGWQVRWAVTCEACKAAGPQQPRSDLAEEAAAAAGWRSGTWHGMPAHLCPACRDKPPDREGFKWPADDRLHTEQPRISGKEGGG